MIIYYGKYFFFSIVLYVVTACTVKFPLECFCVVQMFAVVSEGSVNTGTEGDSGCERQ